MKTRKLWIGVGLFTLAFLSAVRLGAADPPGRGEGPGRHLERMAERLELTEEQQAKVEAIREGGEAERVKLEKEAMRARHELEGEFLKDAPDRKRVRALVEQLGGVRTRLELLRTEHRLAIREILTPEQRDRFLAMGPRPGSRAIGPRGPRMFGPRGDCHPDRDRRSERRGRFAD